MVDRSLAVIHCQPRIAWQGPWAQQISKGLAAVGIPSRVTSDRTRQDEGFPILLGTTWWQGIENDGGEFLLVDRCQYGDTNKWVSLGWNGRGREADFKVPASFDASRWERYGASLDSWRSGRHCCLCGQIPQPLSWYAAVQSHASVFKPHPADHQNPTVLPTIGSWDDVGKAIVLSSSVAVQTVMMGIPTVTMSPRSMAWDVSAHAPQDTWAGDRLPWCHWLAWCQWSWDEVGEGIRHIWE